MGRPFDDTPVREDIVPKPISLTPWRGMSPSTTLAACLLVVALLGLGDWWTGYEASLLIFYLVPILVGTWRAGRSAGLLLCAASTAAGVAADLAGGLVYSSPLVHLWNPVAYASMFATMTVVLDILKQALERERRLARRDPLTGLANRNAFFELAQTEVARCRRYRRSLTLAFVDCDHFKEVNDRLGHEAGDRCLQAVAEAMETSVRRTDLAARLGGDEFAMVFPELEGERAREVVEKVKERLEAAMRAGGWPVTFSIGVVSAREPLSADELLRRADALMYLVKRSGRNAIELEFAEVAVGAA